MREAELERASLLEGRLDQLKYETQQQEVRIFNRHPVFKGLINNQLFKTIGFF